MQVIILVLAVILGCVALLFSGIEGIGWLRRLYEQGGEQHWDLLGAQVGLLHGHSARGDHVLDGQRCGVWLHVEAEGAWMVIRGRIEVPMPPRFAVVHRRRGASPGVLVGSPVLDDLVHVQGDPPAASLLQDPELAGVLLAVVHAWPGSAIDERHVTLRCPDALGRQLMAQCDEVVALVEALRVAARKMPERGEAIAPR